jgi:CubicO group peptidase (beta-lactamase class C family)
VSTQWVDPDVAGDERQKLLTPRILLSHRAGFANWRRETKGVLTFQFDPGTKYQYSGEGFEYLRHFVERKTGGPVNDLASRYLFGPRKMSSTSFVQQPWFASRIALPKNDKGEWGAPSFSTTGNAADDVYTTIDDYARFVVGVMNHEGLSTRLAHQRDSLHAVDPNGLPPCDPKTVKVCPLRAGYALGWGVLEYPAVRVLWHTGSDAGEKTMVFYFPERREGAVMFTNGSNGFQVIIDVGILLFPDSEFADFLRSGKE